MTSAASARPSVAEFYGGAGRALLDRGSYPPAIARHLDSERALLRWIVGRGGYTAAVEVGCADGGVNLDTLLKLRVRYLGIDVVPSFVHQSNRRLENSLAERSSRAYLLDARRLSELCGEFQSHKTLVVFSFNSFGNLEDPDAALAEISALGVDLLILTYQTGAGSTDIRRDYYEKCDLLHMRQSEDHRGVVFRSADGLCSYAYRRPWLLNMLRSHALQCAVGEFGAIGRSFWAGPARDGL